LDEELPQAESGKIARRFNLSHDEWTGRDVEPPMKPLDLTQTSN